MLKKGIFLTAFFAVLVFVLPISVRAETSTEAKNLDLTTIETSVLSNEMIAREVAEECCTGTLLFSEGDCLTIRCYTWSPYTHVAIVMMENDQPVVYDSMNGIGVRRLPLGEYIQFESYATKNIVVMNPVKEFTPDQEECLKAYLDSQLGRPYSVRHYVVGSENEGIHCSEYVSAALKESNLLKVERPHKVSPASLYEGVETGKLYDISLTKNLVRPLIQRKMGKSWYGQIWLDTKYCYKVCHFKLATWGAKCK